MPRIIVFTKPADPYSVRLCEFLRRKKVSFKEVPVTDDDPDAYMQLVEMTGESEAPQLVVDGVLVGDYERVTSLDLQGKLDELLGA